MGELILFPFPKPRVEVLSADARVKELERATAKAKVLLDAAYAEYRRKNAVPIIGLWYSNPAYRRYMKAFDVYDKVATEHLAALGAKNVDRFAKAFGDFVVAVLESWSKR